MYLGDPSVYGPFLTAGIRCGQGPKPLSSHRGVRSGKGRGSLPAELSIDVRSGEGQGSLPAERPIGVWSGGAGGPRRRSIREKSGQGGSMDPRLRSIRQCSGLEGARGPRLRSIRLGSVLGRSGVLSRFVFDRSPVRRGQRSGRSGRFQEVSSRPRSGSGGLVRSSP